MFINPFSEEIQMKSEPQVQIDFKPINFEIIDNVSLATNRQSTNIELSNQNESSFQFDDSKSSSSKHTEPEQVLLKVSTITSAVKAKPAVAPPAAGARKNAGQKKLLLAYYQQYCDGMDEKQW